MDQINSNREKVVTSIFRRSRAGNSVVRDRIWPNFNLVQALMYDIVTCKNEKDLIKTAEKKWQHLFSHYVFGDFLRRSRAANSTVRGRIWPNFERL